MRISDWSSDVCSSDLIPEEERPNVGTFIVLASDGTPKVSHRYFSTAAPKREKRAAPVTEDAAAPAAIANVFPRSLQTQISTEPRAIHPIHVPPHPRTYLLLPLFTTSANLHWTAP